MSTGAVIGAGAWGTALADLLARNGHDVCLWAYEPEVAESINREHRNHLFLDGQDIAPAVRSTNDLDESLAGAEFVIFATPSHVLRRVAHAAAPRVSEGVRVIVATKGIDRESLSLMSEILMYELPRPRVVALSGPSFASEVAQRQPTAVVVASEDPDSARWAQSVFSCAHFRAYTHDDIAGVQLGGALKNVMAVATGIAEGLGLGFNARAALITRGLAEMTRLASRLGGNPATLGGLSGLGDLVLTCTGALSRNRAVGLAVGEGRTLREILASRSTVAEGVTTTRSAKLLAEREGVEMPIVAAVHRVLFDGCSAGEELRALMTRDLRPEVD